MPESPGMAALIKANEWDRIGYLAYPSSRDYPYPNKYGFTAETKYIRGWNKARLERNSSGSMGDE